MEFKKFNKVKRRRINIELRQSELFKVYLHKRKCCFTVAYAELFGLTINKAWERLKFKPKNGHRKEKYRAWVPHTFIPKNRACATFLKNSKLKRVTGFTNWYLSWCYDELPKECLVVLTTKDGMHAFCKKGNLWIDCLNPCSSVYYLNESIRHVFVRR